MSGRIHLCGKKTGYCLAKFIDCTGTRRTFNDEDFYGLMAEKVERVFAICNACLSETTVFCIGLAPSARRS